MTKVVCDICGKEIDKRAIHLHMRVHEGERGGEVGEGGKIYDYHVLFPDLTCVVRDGSDVYVTPVLALHISAKGGWMIICDKSGNLVRSDAVQECYICSGKKEVKKLLQVADACSGALYDALDINQYGNVEASYLLGLANKFDRSSGRLWGIGLKLFPRSMQAVRGEYNCYEWMSKI